MQYNTFSDHKWFTWSFVFCPNDLARLNSMITESSQIYRHPENSGVKFNITLQDIITALKCFIKNLKKYYEETEIVH